MREKQAGARESVQCKIGIWVVRSFAPILISGLGLTTGPNPRRLGQPCYLIFESLNYVLVPYLATKAFKPLIFPFFLA